MVFMTSGSPPFRMPLFMIATRGLNGVNEHLRIRTRLSVVETQKHFDWADAIVRTHEFEFLVSCQISQMNRVKLAEGNVDSDGLRILGIVIRSLKAGAVWIGFARTVQRRLDGFPRRGQHAHIETSDRILSPALTTVCFDWRRAGDRSSGETDRLRRRAVRLDHGR